MARLRIKGIEARNFRGIRWLQYPSDGGSSNEGFSDLNLIVGPNGHGKSSLMAAIAHMLCALRSFASNRAVTGTFRDADFRFVALDQAEPLSIKINFELDGREQAPISLQAQRLSQGSHRSWINGQAPCTLVFHPAQIPGDIGRLLENIQVTASGFRVCPIYESATPGHAATTQQDDRGFLDQFRARIVEILTETDIGRRVGTEIPRLQERVLETVNALLGQTRFLKFHLGYGNSLVVQHADGSFVSWDTLSGGEKQIFHFAHLLVERPAADNSFYFIEEPENQVHPGLQREFLRSFLQLANASQVFIVTQSSGYLELDDLDARNTRHLLCVREGEHNEVVNMAGDSISRLLPRLGVTSRSVGQARTLLLVEGPSDAIFLGGALQALLIQDGITTPLSQLVDICHLAPPKTVLAAADINESDNPGWRLSSRTKAIRLNLYRPGVTHYFVLFDSDVGSESEAREFGAAVREALQSDSPSVTVIDPWYRTLESLYDGDLWAIAHPTHSEGKKALKWTTARHWKAPIDNFSWGFSSHPAESTLKQTKFRSAETIVRWRGFSKWVKRNRTLLAALEPIVSHLRASTLLRLGD